MSNTTQRSPRSLKRVTKREITLRLRDARAKNKELAEEGKLLPPTKNWSKTSLESLRTALSSQPKETA